MGISQWIRDKAEEFLEQSDTSCFIGYGKGTLPHKTMPVFIKTREELDKLTWNPFCINNLVTYLKDNDFTNKKVGVVVKGCDSLSLCRLLKDNQISRDDLGIIGVPCNGMIDPNKLDDSQKLENVDFIIEDNEVIIKSGSGEVTYAKEDIMYDKCLKCINPVPLEYDELYENKVEPAITELDDFFKDVERFEQLSIKEKKALWNKYFSKCIRCYACRNICAACSCRQCVFEQVDPEWLGKRTNSIENQVFHLTRAMHVAGRCTGCNECVRACPVNIPMNRLYEKLGKDIHKLFGVDPRGIKPGEDNSLEVYDLNDPEEFM